MPQSISTLWLPGRCTLTKDALIARVLSIEPLERVPNTGRERDDRDALTVRESRRAGSSHPDTRGISLFRPPAANPHLFSWDFTGTVKAPTLTWTDSAPLVEASGGLVSIHGLPRFYQRRADEAVASWMTRQDREVAIADKTACVAAALDAVSDEWPTMASVVSAGFHRASQWGFARP
jgi:hypothetical protein